MIVPVPVEGPLVAAPRTASVVPPVGVARVRVCPCARTLSAAPDAAAGHWNATPLTVTL